MNACYQKIKVENPIVDIDGDEMTRIIWGFIREKIINKFLDIKLIYFDLSLTNRESTSDEVTLSTISAIKKHKIAIKCATINPDEALKQTFNLSKLWVSPNATIRGALNGTIIREPIIINKIPKLIGHWKNSIIVARHAYADLWDAKELYCETAQKAFLVLEKENSDTDKILIHDFSSEKGVVLGCFQTDESISDFAEFCFENALKRKIPLYLSTKNTILKMYDGKYKNIFEEIYQQKYLQNFKEVNIFYEHKLIDDMVAFALRSEGGFMWACKNHDGDVQSNLVVQGFGSLGLMTSVVYAKDGVVLCEAGHGTITKHFKDHLKGLETSTNSISAIFAWSRALRERASLDGNSELLEFAEKMEHSVSEAVEGGFFTKDLGSLVYKIKDVPRNLYLNTEEFIDKVAEILNSKMTKIK